MIECLLKRYDEGLSLRDDVLERAMRPDVPHTVGPGRWTIDVGGDRFVDFSPEPWGLQMSFEDSIERELAERVAAQIAANLASMTGGTFQLVWLS